MYNTMLYYYGIYSSYYCYLLLYTILYCYTRGQGLDKSLCQPMELLRFRRTRPSSTARHIGSLELGMLSPCHLLSDNPELRDISKVLHAVTLSISPLSLWVTNQWFQSVSRKITEKSRITQGADNILLVLNVGNWGMGWWLIVTIDYNRIQ